MCVCDDDILVYIFFFFNYSAPPEINPYLPTLSLPAALPIGAGGRPRGRPAVGRGGPHPPLPQRNEDDDAARRRVHRADRSEEHTFELQSLMRISYAVFCLKKKKQ